MWSIFKSKNMTGLIRFLTIILLELSFGNTNRVLSDVLSSILNESNYDYRLRPFADEGDPLNISITMNVNEISHISEIQMEYSMTCFIRQEWMDPRLAYTNYTKSITLNFNQFDRLWTPDLFIRNLKSGFLHTITEPNRLLRIHPDGKVLYSQRLSMTLTCDMVLHRYPMDNQTCFVELGSYAYTTDDLNFIWKPETDEPVELNNEISLAEYEITQVTHVKCNKLYESTGSFPCLKANFHLNRRLKAYMLTTYLPSLLVVVLSWLSFWIDADSTPARTSLSILTILTVTTQSSALVRSTPANSFTKASDIWMATCLVFVFAAFIEYSIVNTLARRQKKKQSKMSAKCTLTSSMHTDQSTLPENHDCSPHFSLNKRLARYLKDRYENNPALLVEIISRVLFPVLFLIFNLVYWPMYLTGYTFK